MEEENKAMENSNLVPTVEEGIRGGAKGIVFPVRKRVQDRRKELATYTATEHYKYMRGNLPDWKDEPAKFHIGELTPAMSNGVGELNYVVYMRDPETGNKVHSISGGGPIQQFYVKEVFAPHKPAVQEVTEIEGVPSIQEAVEALKKEREESKERGKRR